MLSSGYTQPNHSGFDDVLSLDFKPPSISWNVFNITWMAYLPSLFLASERKCIERFFHLPLQSQSLPTSGRMGFSGCKNWTLHKALSVILTIFFFYAHGFCIWTSFLLVVSCTSDQLNAFHSLSPQWDGESIRRAKVDNSCVKIQTV